MKKFVYSLFLIGFFMMTGCAPLPPYEIKPQTPNLNIAQSQIKPFRVALVVQDPMPYTLFYQGEKGYSRDGTAETRAGGFMLERDLSKIASDTFSQVFKQVVVLRDLPQPGQYDATVNLNIGQILLKEKVILTGETCDITAAWTMSLLDNQNREILSRQGISPAHNFPFSILTPDRDIILGMNEKLSLILTQLAQEWGTILYKAELQTAGR